MTGTGDSIANDGVVTLREAITAANTNAGPSGDTAPGDPGLDAHDAGDQPGREPRIFFMDPAANPDRSHHVHVREHDDSISLAWEDLLGGGDRDFNDMVLNVRAVPMRT